MFGSAGGDELELELELELDGDGEGVRDRDVAEDDVEHWRLDGINTENDDDDGV